MPPTKKKPTKNKPSTSSKPTARLSMSATIQKPTKNTNSTETKIPKIHDKKTIDNSNDTKQKIATTAEPSSNPETQEQILIGFPNHLFKLETWDLINTNQQHVDIHFILYEHPIFYGHRQTPGKLDYNKSRLIYVHAAILAYLDYLNSHLNKPITINTTPGATQQKQQTIKLLSVSFVSVDDCLANKSALTAQINKLIRPKQHIHSTKTTTLTATTVKYWDPVDCELSHKVIEEQLGHNGQQNTITKLESPLFLTTEADLAEYHTKHATGRFTHSAFYDWQKNRPAHKDFKFPGHSYDTQNRGQMPQNTQIPPLPTITTNDHKYLLTAEQYISKHREWGAKTRPGASNTINNIVFPISHQATQDWFQNFLVKKLNKFGKYQDSIDGQARNYLFHSCISPMMNLGLITPREIIEATHKYYLAHQSEVGIANYEGFIRQVIGWREYQRYIYLYAGDKMRKSNHFSNHGGLTPAWYSGELGIRPVDDAIKMAFRDGYLHHILRLMVMGNFMNLAGLHPDEVYRWFMEFALDSYDWVMIGNVYSMALWADGGLSMRKPYISSDTYIMSLGTYAKEPDNLPTNSGSASTTDTDNEAQSSSHQTYSSESISSHHRPQIHLGWNRVWYVLFYDFINRCQSQLKSTYYAGLVKAWNNKSSSEKTQILADSKLVLKQILA
jgi:deoxyribodipyrimidine photolyase-related protein